MNESKNLAQRLLAITEDIGTVEKGGKAPSEMGGFAYVKADDVATAVRKQLVRHGVLATWTVAEQTTEQVTFNTKSGPRSNFFVQAHLDVTFTNVDAPEESMTVRTMGHGIDSSDKAPGKAVTYALKTLYIGLFHLRGQVDNESEDVGEATASAVPLTDQERTDFEFLIDMATDLKGLEKVAKELRERGVTGQDRERLTAAWKDKHEALKAKEVA
jgi:ERF superfamily